MTKSAIKRFITSFFSEYPLIAAGLILIICLAPFADKAVQTDDALFVWAGQWIQKHPINFYGGSENWWGTSIPMWEANVNPPLMSYFLAGVAFLGGWNEISLHLGCLVISLAAMAGIFTLAKRWCGKPVLAATIAMFTPAFLVSSSTLMCDLLMLSFWVWALVFWERACETRNHWKFAVAGLLAGLAFLTKYSAVCLLPLLALLGILQMRKFGWWVIGLLVPLLIIAAYEWLTTKLYGQGLLFAAGQYAHSNRVGFTGVEAKVIIGLAFAGGSLLPPLFFIPWLWPWRIWLTGGTLILMGILGVFWLGGNPGLIHPWMDQSIENYWGFRLQAALLVFAGVHLLLLAVAEFWQRRDIISITLVAWIIGMFAFAGALNWTINARSFLPAAPAIAILTVRRMERLNLNYNTLRWLFAPILITAVIALSLVIADYQMANSVKLVAKQILANYQSPDHKLWFQGHGGFQYYLQKFGAQPVDVKKSKLQTGDTVAVSWSSGNYVVLPAESVGAVGVLGPQAHSWMNLSGSNQYGIAGFYDADWGPLPFTIGAYNPAYLIVKMFADVQYPLESVNASSAQNSSNNPEAAKQIQLAKQLQNQGDVETAVQCYQKALTADPNCAEALNDLAWILSTTEDPALRNGGEALQLAQKATALTHWRQPLIIETLSAAYAEDGQFANATGLAELARQLAMLTGRSDIAAQSARLESLYAAGSAVFSTSSQ